MALLYRLLALALLVASASAQHRPWFAQTSPELVYSSGQNVMDWFADRLWNIREMALEFVQGAPAGTAAAERQLNADDATGRTLPDGFFRFIPTYVASGLPGKEASWSSPCFRSNKLSVDEASNGDAVLTFEVSDPASMLCADTYVVLTVEGFHPLHVVRRGKHTVHWSFPSNTTTADRAWVAREGFRVFRFLDASPLKLAGDLLRTLELFAPVMSKNHSGVQTFSAEANLRFLKDYTNVVMEPRHINYVDIDESYFKPGDFLGIIRLDGLDPMQVFGTGAHTGHTTIIMEIDGVLHVLESTDKTAYWPKPNIQRTPLKEWLKLARAADYQVVHLPLKAEMRAKFNQTAALEWFSKVEGMPYGYHNFIWGWVDTEAGNLPWPLEWQLMEPAFGLVEKYEPAVAVRMWGEAFNFRVGTKNVGTVELINEALKKNITFGDLMAMPESDSWVYSDGYSMVCDVFVCSMYKHGGLFGDIADEIQCTEFQNWDVETLAFFDTKPDRPQACIDADPDLPNCQIMGKYRLRIPGYGTVTPYPHMRENCAALPPKFERKPGC